LSGSLTAARASKTEANRQILKFAQLQCSIHVIRESGEISNESNRSYKREQRRHIGNVPIVYLKYLSRHDSTGKPSHLTICRSFGKTGKFSNISEFPILSSQAVAVHGQHQCSFEAPCPWCFFSRVRISDIRLQTATIFPKCTSKILDCLNI